MSSLGLVCRTRCFWVVYSREKIMVRLVKEHSKSSVSHNDRLIHLNHDLTANNQITTIFEG